MALDLRKRCGWSDRHSRAPGVAEIILDGNPPVRFHQAMRMAQLLKKGLMLGVFICLAGYERAQANPIIYTLSGTANGSLGANSFSAASFIITSTADTSEIANNPLFGTFFVPNITATVFVSGLGSATFTIPTISLDNQNNASVGISAPNQNRAIVFASNNPLLSSYDLSTSLGPLTGIPHFNSSTGFGTTAGDFYLTSVTTVTFQAVEVPEQPSTLALSGIASIGLFVQLVRHRKLNT